MAERIIIKSLCAFFLAVFTVPSLSYGADKFVRKGESSYREIVDEKGLVRITENVTFAYHNEYVGYSGSVNEFRDVLISTKITSKERPGEEGADSSLEAVAWIIEEKDKATKLWTIKDRADGGGMRFYYYQTFKHGCCGAETIYRAFDSKTGKYMFSYTINPVYAYIPNTDVKRTISYISSNAQVDYDYYKKWPRGMGVLAFSEGALAKERIMIESDNGDFSWSPRKILLVDKANQNGTTDLAIWQSNGKASSSGVTGFSIKLVFYEDGDDAGTVVIPVVGDRLDIINAVMPKGVSLRRMPLADKKR